MRAHIGMTTIGSRENAMCAKVNDFFLFLQKIAITVEFSYNTQSWQYWHFCTTFNEEKIRNGYQWNQF